MNRYGEMALRHWQQHRAEELATISDPVRFFRELGEQVSMEIGRRAALLEPSTLSGDFLANLGTLDEARQTAESEVLRELVLTEPPADPAG